MNCIYYNNTESERLISSQNDRDGVEKNIEDDFLKLGSSYITVHDLKSVHLNPITPNPTFYSLKKKNYAKVDLRNLNKDQLDSILNVKLRPTHQQNSSIKRIYEVRHPCLRELLKSREIIN